MIVRNSSHTQCIAFVHNKGGSGKTTACLNVAGWLSKMNQSVLVVDLDPKGNATSGLGIDLSSVQQSIFDTLIGKNHFEEIILETKAGVYCAPVSESSFLEESKTIQSLKNEFVLKKKLQPIKQYFDYILFDVPPSANLLMKNSITAAKNLFIPLDTGVFSYETLSTLMLTLKKTESKLNSPLKIKAFLLKSFSPSYFDKKITNQMKTLLTRFSETLKLEKDLIQTIPFSKKVIEAQMLGLPISHYAPQSDVGRTYHQIAKQLIK